jgi:acyl carrier protein
MNRGDYWKTALLILAREVNVDSSQISDDQLLREDLVVDSIVALNLIFAFERELGLTVTEEDVVSLRTVRDLRLLVERLAGKAQPE